MKVGEKRLARLITIRSAADMLSIGLGRVGRPGRVAAGGSDLDANFGLSLRRRRVRDCVFDHAKPVLDYRDGLSQHIELVDNVLECR